MIKVAIKLPKSFFKNIPETDTHYFGMNEDSSLNDFLILVCKELNIDKIRLFKSDIELNRFINFYINNEDVRFLDGLNTKLSHRDEVVLIPAIAGG